MRILVTGKEGQVATALQQAGDATPGIEVVRLGRPEIDLARPEGLEAPVREARPDLIISAAAYTAVDKAESERAAADAVNGDGPAELARLAAALDVPLLHLSTDYVFAGDKDGPYVETDTPGPATAYGLSKLSGEMAIETATPNHVILRTAWVYAPYGHNFVRTMLRLGETRDEVDVVADQQGCPTYAPEIARILLAISQRIVADSDPALRGIFHFAGQGETTWAGFAEAVFAGAARRGRHPVHVRPIATSAYPTPARRPRNSRLNSQKLHDIYGMISEPWQVSLGNCLDRLLETTTERSL